MIKFSIRNLLKRKTRSLLTLSGIIIGVAMIISLVSVSEGLSKLATDFVSNFQGIFVMQRDAPDDMFSRVELKDAGSIASIAGVKSVSGQINGIVTNVDGSGSASLYGGSLDFFVGTNVGDSDLMKSLYNVEVERGRFLVSGDKYRVVIGSGASDSYNKNVGDKISFNGKDFRIVGILKKSSTITNSIFIIPLEVAQELSGFDKGLVSLFAVIPSDPAEVDDIVRRIDLRYPHLDAYSPQDFSSMAGGYLSTMTLAFWLISIVAGIVGGIGVANTMITSVYERTKEIGILRAVGWTQRNIITLILTEGVVLSLIGGFIGVLLGSVVANFIGSYTGFDAYVSSNLIFQAMTFALTVGLVGGLYPAVKAARMDPVMSLRYE